MIPRKKPRSLLAAGLYRTTALARTIFGKKKVMRLLLNLTFTLDRLAVESVADIYGSEYFDSAHAVDVKLLESWIPRDSTVIDIGCGRGFWTKEVAKIAKEVVGIDRDSNLIEIAKQNKPDNVEFIVGDVSDTLSFDIAILFHILEHIDDPVEFLKSLPVNSLIIEVPDHEFDFLNVVRKRNSLPYYTDADHVREYTREMLREDLGKAGFQIIELLNLKASLVCLARKESKRTGWAAY